MRQTMQPYIIYAGVNMFMPVTVKINPDSKVKWRNDFNLPHKVVGTYNKSALGSQPLQRITIDSDFI